MKKFFWGFAPYAAVSILFFLVVGGAGGMVPASGESWLFPWTWAMDETRDMVVAGLNGLATITTLSFIGLGVLVASTPAVEAKAEDFRTKREEASKAKGEKRGRPAGHKDPPQGEPSAEAVKEHANTFVGSDHN